MTAGQKKKDMKKDKRILIPRDEFEEEAGEGLGQLSREEAEADLGDLKARMERRMRRPRAVWLPAAAAVVILVIASGILVTMLRKGSTFDSRLAQRGMAMEEIILEADTAYMAMTGEAVTDTALIAMAAPIEKRGHETVAPAEKKGYLPAAPTTAGQAVTETVTQAADEVFGVVEEDDGVEKVAEEPVVAMQVAEAEKVEAVQAEEVVVQALPQARAAAPKTKAVAETKADVQAAGKAAAGEGQAIIREPAAPVGGWTKYMEWVVRNIRYPSGVEPIMRQEVQVSFTVLPDSTLSDLEVVRSPGEPFTTEAFRLLRVGPKWVPAQGDTRAKSEKVVVTFVFK